MLMLFLVRVAFGKELLIRFPVRVFRERFSIGVLLSLLVLKLECEI